VRCLTATSASNSLKRTATTILLPKMGILSRTGLYQNPRLGRRQLLACQDRGYDFHIFRHGTGCIYERHRRRFVWKWRTQLASAYPTLSDVYQHARCIISHLNRIFTIAISHFERPHENLLIMTTMPALSLGTISSEPRLHVRTGNLNTQSSNSSDLLRSYHSTTANKRLSRYVSRSIFSEEGGW